LLTALPRLLSTLAAGLLTGLLLVRLTLLTLILLAGLLPGLVLAVSHPLAALTLLALLTLLLTLLALIHVVTHWRSHLWCRTPSVQNCAEYVFVQKILQCGKENPGAQGRDLHAGKAI
jgi:hypothetical protein